MLPCPLNQLVMPKSYKGILNRVGWSLILFGLLDLLMMVYRGRMGLSYISSFYGLAAIAGIFLLRGNLRTAAWMTGVTAFYSMVFAFSTLTLTVVTHPLNLWITRLRLNPIFMMASVLFTGAFMVYLPWLYGQLRRPQIVSAYAGAGLGTAPPIGAWASGVGVGIALSVIIFMVFNSNDAAEALRRAELQLGPDYNYRLSSINWRGSEVQATVTAYTHNSIESIEIEWME